MRKAEIARKIEALLNKTVERGATEAEALAATRKAQELMSKYDIALTDIVEEKEEIGEDVFQATRRWAQALAATVGANMRCEVLKYTVDRCTMIRFIGRDTDRSIALKTYKMLLKACKNGIQRVRAETQLRGENTRGVDVSYALGFITAVREEMSRSTMALMLVVPEDVTAYMHQNHDNIKNTIMKFIYGSKEAYEEGSRDGQEAVGRRQITEGAR